MNTRNMVWSVLFSFLLLSPSFVLGKSVEKEDTWLWKTVKSTGKFAVAGAVGAGAVAGAPIVLGAAGFTATGIAAGSIAAAVQSKLAFVAAGSAFSALQSAGMAGIGIAAKATIASVASAVGYKLADKVVEDKDGNKRK